MAMRMGCRIARVLLRSRTTGDAGSGWLDRHLAACPRCSSEAMHIEGLASLLRESCARTEECAPGWEQVRAKLEPRVVPVAVGMRRAAVAATLAVVVLASSAAVLWRLGAQPQPPAAKGTGPAVVTRPGGEPRPARGSGNAERESGGVSTPGVRQPAKPAIKPQSPSPRPRITLPPRKRWFAKNRPVAPAPEARKPEPREMETGDKEPMLAVVQTEEYVMDVVGTSADAGSDDIYAIHQVAASPPDSDEQFEL